MRLSVDGSRLYCVNNPNGTLSVFDITSPLNPVLLIEIPVGMEPVSVNPRTSDEVWVVNQESDSVSVVSVSKGIVVDTIQAADEPADVVFAGPYAFVSLARNNLINVYDAVTHALVKSIPVFGGGPRALAVSPDGSTLYAAFAMSGNGTTGLNAHESPPPPPPVNPALPPAPKQGIIIQWNDPAWSADIHFTMPDNDVVAIDTSTLAILRYYSGVGTINLGLAVQPSTGNLFVSNTDALNLIRFETALNGHFVNNRITKITPAGTLTAYDLNPGFTYSTTPNPAEISIALAQPANIVFDGTGANMYVSSFGTDRVARVDVNGNILSRIEINPHSIGASVSPTTKRGPRGLAINNSTQVLYVHNRISNSLSVVDTTINQVIAEIPTGRADPTTPAVRGGRGFLYDAKLSGNGTGSCAACHIDGESDHLSWDLGDPTGTLFPVALDTGRVYLEHPMKGPMTTLTLRGLAKTQPYHWRGDKPAFSDFNAAFSSLMAGNELSNVDMQTYTNFVNTILFMPNPNQNLDRSFQTSLNGGNAVNGAQEFKTVFVNPESQTCNTCHLVSNFYGSDLLIRLLGKLSIQPSKDTPLRALYQKQLYSTTGQTIDGFGLIHDGTIGTIVDFLNSGIFPSISNKPQIELDLAAYSISFDTGMAPAAGYGFTLNASNVTSAATASTWNTMQSQAAALNCDLVAEGTVNQQIVGMLYDPPSNTYSVKNGPSGQYSGVQLAQFVQAGDTITLLGLPPGTGSRVAAR